MRCMMHDYTLDTATDLSLGTSTDILSLSDKANNEGTRFSQTFNKSMKWLATRERFKIFT